MRTLALATENDKPSDNYVRRLVARVTALGRSARLRRQFAEIERRSLELPRSYREQLSDLIVRERDLLPPDTQPDHREPGARSLDTSLERARSSNVQLRMRGIAAWVAVVHHETAVASTPEAEALHRQVLRLTRTLKDSVVVPDSQASHA